MADGSDMDDSDAEKYSRSSHESDDKRFPLDLISSQPDRETPLDIDESDNKIDENNGKSQTDATSLLLEQQEPDLRATSGDLQVFSNNTKDDQLTDKSSEDIEANGTQKSGTKNPTKCAKCCTSCHRRCLLWCRPCLTEHNPLPESPTRCKKTRHAFMCPPHGKIARWLTLFLAIVFVYGALWGITGDEALPGGNIFAILVLFVCCMLGGALVEMIKLPALLGMLLVGCLLNNVPKIDVAKDIDPIWSSALRSIALVVILIRAGLGLDPKALRKLSFGVIRLAFIPCLTETVATAVCSYLLLGFPWSWGFMLGFVLSAVSPAVVVPSMLSLTEHGLGVDQGIPTLVIAAASVDDVLAISGFGVVLGMAFSTGNIALTIAKGPLEAMAGIVYGVLFGVIIWYLPHQKHTNKTFFRFVLLFCAGLLAQFGSRRADISGAGALGCLTLAFVAALLWRKDSPVGKNMPIEKLFAALWVIFQPLLFGLIGAEVDIGEIQGKTIGLGIAVLCIGLTLRLIASFLAVFGLGLNMKEKLFIPLAWLPKATVQAAIGSIALDTAREKLPQNPDDIALGKQVLTIAVLVILITAPIGAIAIALSAPRLLRKRAPAVYEVQVEEQEGATIQNIDEREEETLAI